LSSFMIRLLAGDWTSVSQWHWGSLRRLDPVAAGNLRRDPIAHLAAPTDGGADGCFSRDPTAAPRLDFCSRFRLLMGALR